MIETHLPAYIALTFVLFSVLIPLFGFWKKEWVSLWQLQVQE